MRWRVMLGLLLILIARLAAAQTADAALQRLLDNAPTAADYPDADAVWLLRDMEITIDPSGAYTVREHKLAKILTPQGAALAQWEIPYDRIGERLTVRVARTWWKGQAFAADPAQAMDNPVYPGLAWYDSMVVRRFPLPVALPGAVLEVETEHRRLAPRVPGAFSTRLYLRQHYPIHEARFQLRTPSDRPLVLRFSGGDSPRVEEVRDGNDRVYRWTQRRLPALRLTEPQLPPADDLIPSARVTSLTGWAPVVEWYRTITQGKDTVTDELRRIAVEATAGHVTPTAKMTALHALVRRIPYVALEMGDLSDIPHSAEEVARQNYGDCKDKATLLRALLKAVDIPADYVLVRTTGRGRLDPAQYGADEFNHVLLAVALPEGDHFLDATVADVPTGQLPPGVDGADGLIVRGTGQVVVLPASPATANVTTIQVRATLAATGRAEGTVKLAFTGLNAIVQRGILAGVARDRYRDALEGYLAPRLGLEVGIDAVTVDGLQDLDRPLTVTAHFSSPAYLQPAGVQLSGQLPSFTYQPNAFRTIRDRAYPLYSPSAHRLQQDVQLTVPDSLQITHLPTPVQVTTVAGTYRDAATFTQGQLRYTCDLIVQHGTFPPSALEDFRRWSATIALEGRNNLQFFARRL